LILVRWVPSLFPVLADEMRSHVLALGAVSAVLTLALLYRRHSGRGSSASPGKSKSRRAKKRHSKKNSEDSSDRAPALQPGFASECYTARKAASTATAKTVEWLVENAPALISPPREEAPTTAAAAEAAATAAAQATSAELANLPNLPGIAATAAAVAAAKPSRESAGVFAVLSIGCGDGELDLELIMVRRPRRFLAAASHHAVAVPAPPSLCPRPPNAPARFQPRTLLGAATTLRPRSCSSTLAHLERPPPLLSYPSPQALSDALAAAAPGAAPRNLHYVGLEPTGDLATATICRLPPAGHLPSSLLLPPDRTRWPSATPPPLCGATPPFCCPARARQFRTRQPSRRA